MIFLQVMQLLPQARCFPLPGLLNSKLNFLNATAFFKMARSPWVPCKFSSGRFRSAPYPSSSYGRKDSDKEVGLKRTSTESNKSYWEDVACSVCMVHPHEAVLQLCASHDKGCRLACVGLAIIVQIAAISSRKHIQK